MDGQQFRAATIDEVAFGKREITLIAVPYDTETTINEWEGPIREKFMPGSFAGVESRAKYITLNRDHSRERLIGTTKALDPKNARGLIATMRVSDTLLGTESLQLALDGALFASIAFSVRSQDMVIKDGIRTIYRAFLHHIALTPEPAYEGAEVLDVRSGEPLPPTPTPNLDIAAQILREIAPH